MSMISEQVKELRWYSENFLLEDTDVSAALQRAAETIEDLSAKLHAANMERSSAHYNGGWIPCSERSPEKDGIYMVAWKLQGETAERVMESTRSTLPHYYELAEFDGEEGWGGVEQAEGNLCVLAWMPLPQPYKGE